MKTDFEIISGMPVLFSAVDQILWQGSTNKILNAVWLFLKTKILRTIIVDYFNSFRINGGQKNYIYWYKYICRVLLESDPVFRIMTNLESDERWRKAT